MKNVLVIGAGSDIAKEYISRLDKNINVWQTSKTGLMDCKLDLTAPEQLPVELMDQTFDVVLVFAAMSKLAECEMYPALAKAINCDALIYLHKRLKAKHWIVLSTNSVFSGELKITPPDQKHSPFNQYGHTKAQMEAYFEEHKSKASIIRLTKVLTPKFIFFRDSVNKIRAGEHVNVFSDMVISPLTISQVAEYLVKLTSMPVGGIHQLSGLQDVSYFDALKYVVGQIGLPNDLIIPIPKTVPSPKHTCLFVNQLSLDLGFEPKPYKHTLSELSFSLFK